VTAINGWLLAYDNITTIPDWLSDSLCRVVFGGGFSGRALYSDDERSVVFAQRPVILNGIEDYAIVNT
jgi:putative DNA primase/helicase